MPRRKLIFRQMRRSSPRQMFVTPTCGLHAKLRQRTPFHFRRPGKLIENYFFIKNAFHAETFPSSKKANN